MNFVGKFDEKLPVDGLTGHDLAGHNVAHAHVDGSVTHAPADAIIVSDAQLLFGGDFKRSGVDLILTKDDHELVLHDYFKGEKRVALSSPDGAHLTGDLVNALAGHVDYAQAGGAIAAAAVVGHVTKLVGSATAIRNGVSIILNQGDNIEKGDVLQSGADSTLGVTFIDGTVFGLSSNARMVVNEMIYDPNGSNNSSLLSLVAGTISFVAGETAKHGDMKVDTPVATMGIRGTAVLVEIDFSVPGGNGAPAANFQVLVEPDGSTGSYILFDKNTLAPLATVNTAGTLTKISQGIVSFQTGTALSPDVQKLITDVFQQKFTDNNDNTKTIDHAFTDTPVPQSLAPIKLANGPTATPIVINVASSGPSSSNGPSTGTNSIVHIPGAPDVHTFNNAFTELPGVTGSHTNDIVTGQIRFADINAGDLPTVKAEFTSFAYQDAHHNDITASLSPHEQAAIAAIEGISVEQNPGNQNTGSATWTYSFPDGALDFLGAGETLTLTYTAVVNNNYAPNPETNRSQTFTVTITGTNDVPVITSSIPQTIAFVGGTSVPGGDLTAHVPTSGTLTFDDADLTDTHTVAVKLLLGGLNLPPTPLQILENALTASIKTDSTGTGVGTVNWKLADLPVYLADFVPKGETINLVYAVTVTDSQGATVTQDITVTITGTDTPAVVWIATTAAGQPSGGLWSNAANWETGTVPTASDDAIVITNQLIGLTPSYPVTINAPAEAKSLTMNDFGTSPPELINESTLTIGGAFNMSADSILHNSGTIRVGGLMEVLDNSVLDNSGALILQQGGDFKNQSTITNTGTGSIEISGGTLDVQVAVANQGAIAVDSGATLTIGIATVTGGIVTNGGTLALNGIVPAVAPGTAAPITGTAALADGTLNNTGALYAETGAVLDNETVTNTGTIEVQALGTLTLDDGTLVTNTGGTIKVDATATLTLNDATIGGGTLSNSGTVNIEGSSGATLDGVTITGAGDIEVDFETETTTPLVLEGGTSITDGTLTVGSVGILDVKTAHGATLDGVGVTNNNSIEVFGGSTLTLDDGTSVTNTGGTIKVDATAVLTLNNATIGGGTLSNSGTVDIEGSSGATLDGVTVTGSGHIQIDGVTNPTTLLILEDGTTITGGTLTVGSVGILDVKTAQGATLDDVGITNDNSIELFGASTLTLDDGTSVTNTDGTITVDAMAALRLNGATISGGMINDQGSIHVTGSSAIDGATLMGGAISIDGNQTLTLDNMTINSAQIVAASGSAIQIDAGETLTLSGVTLNGGTLANDGTVHVTGNTNIENATVNGGFVTIDASQAVMLYGVTISGSTVTNSGQLTIASDLGASGATLDHVGITSTAIEVLAATTLTLDDGTLVTNHGIITIDGTGTLTLNDASIAGGTINDYSTVSGAVVAGKIDVTGSSTISNAQLNNGQVTLAAHQTLTLDNDTVAGTSFADIADGAIIQVDSGTILKLNAVTINGGAIDAYSTASGSIIAGDIDVTGTSTISNAALNNGQVTLSANQTLTLDNDTVTGTSFVDTASGASIQIEGSVTLDGVTVTGGTIANTNATLTVDAGQTLTLQVGVTVTGGTLSNSGTVDIEGSSGATLDGVAVTGDGHIQIDGATNATTPLILEDGTTITGGTLTVGSVGILDVKTSSGATLDDVGVTNGHSIEVFGGSTLTFDDGTSVNNGEGTITVDGTGTLALNDASIAGGTIDAYSTASGSIIAGDIDVTGSSTISNAQLNNGQVTLGANQTLTLDNDTVAGTSFFDTANGVSIQIEGSVTLDGVTVTGGTIANTNATLTVDAGQTLTLQGGVKVTGGTLSNSGTVDIEGSSGATLDGVTVTGNGQIQIDGATNATTPLILEDGTTITGGTLTVGSVGLLDIKTALGATFDDVGVTNHGIITIDGTATLTLNEVSIDGGTINDYSTVSGAVVAGDIDVTGSSTISNAALNKGQVTLSAHQTLTLDNDTVTGASFADTADGASIQIEGGVTLDGVTVTGGTIANTNATLTVDANQTLTLQGGVTVTSGTLSNAGTVDIEGSSGATLDGVTVTGDGHIQIDGATNATTPLILEDGTTITGGTLTVGSVGALVVKTSSGTTFDDVGVTNGHSIEVFGGSTLTFDDGTSVTNNGIITIDGTGTLTLNDATINGGTIDAYSTASGSIIAGDIDVTGSSTISNAALYKGQVTLGTNQTLTLDSDTVTGTSFIDTANGAVIQIDGNTILDGVTVTGGSIANTNATLTIDADQTLTLQGGVTVTGGTLSNSGTVDIEGALGATLDGVTVTGSGVIQVDGAVQATTPLVLVDGTTITGGELKLGSVGVLDIESPNGATLNDVAVTNGHLVEIFAGSALALVAAAAIDNTGGVVAIDGTATLTLNEVSIDGGTINDFSTVSGAVVAGDIDVTGSSTISNASFNNGQVTLGANQTLTLDTDTVTGTSFVDTANGAVIHVTGNTTFDRVVVTGGSIANTSATLTVDADQTLTLQGGVTVTGGTLSNSGTIDIEGASGATLDGVTVTGSGHIQVDFATNVSPSLILEGGTTITGGTLTVGSVGVLDIKTAGGATLDDVAVTNGHSIEVFGGSTLTLDDGTSVTNGEGTITVDGTGTLTLNGASIDGGTIDAYSTASGSIIAGDIDVTGSSTISNAALHSGQVTLGANQTLTLDSDTVTGTSFADTASGAAIQVAGNTTFDGAVVTGGAIANTSATLTVDADQTLTLQGGVTVTGGTLNNSGTVDIEGASGATLDGVTVTGGGYIQVDFATNVSPPLILEDGTTITGGTLTVGSVGALDVKTAGGATLDDVGVTNGHSIEVFDGSTLTLDDGTSVTNGEGTITVDGTGTLTLNDASIDGGTIDAYSTASGSIIAGDIDVTGSSTISNAALNNGQVTLGANQTLTLDGDTVTGTSFTVEADGAVIQIDGDTTLKLDRASIDGGTINDFSTVSGAVVAGDIDVIGSSTISNTGLHHGNVSIEDGATLTLVGDTLTGTAFSNVATGSIIQLGGEDTLNGVTIAGGEVNVASDALVKTSGNVTLTNTAVINDGTIEVTGGTLKISGSVADSGPDGSGSIKIDSHAVLEIDGSDTQNVVFAGANGELQVDGSGFGGNISGLAATDQIDLRGISFGADTTGGYSGGVLTITDGSNPPIGMTLVGDYTNAHFGSASDGHGGTLITLNPNDDAPAFAAGDKSESAMVTELANTTGSSALDPLPAASGTLHFTDIDLTDRPTATTTQTVTWADGATDLSSSLTSGEISALENAFSLTQSGNTNNGALGWSYQISDGALDFLGANETATVTTTVTLDDHQSGTDTAIVTININGANDVPTVSATGGGFTELAGITGSPAIDAATGTISFADADINDRPVVTASIASSNPFDYKDINGNDLTSTLTLAQLAAIATLESGLALEPGSANANTGTVGWTYSVADSALDFLAAGDTLTLNYTATVNDQHGGVATAPIAVTITGSDDAPSISGTATATVTDGGIVNASGTLTATDPDRSDAVTWSVVGGTNVASENYNYGLEDFTVVKGTTTIFHDPFTGTVPPVGPDFLVGTTPTSGAYNVTGGSFVAGPTGTLLEGTNAAPVGISLGANANYGDVVYGQYLTLLTGTSYNGAGPTQGLRSGESFTASALFDLNDPVDYTTHYGIRLSDRVLGSAGGVFDQPGTETVDLFVAHDPNGGINVVLDEINFESGTSTVLQTIHIPAASAGITDNEILLNLSNSSANDGHVTASFQVMGTDSDGNEVADGGPVSFTATGQIFDNENWTRAIVYGQSVATSDTAPADVTANAVSVLQGTYGTLDVDQNGAWKYFLNPGLASVKALAEGQTAHDIFTIAATDSSGVQTTKPVDITVTGINDAPVIDAHGSVLGYIENQAPTAIAAALTLSDVDSSTFGSASVQISGNFVAGEDVLGFTDQNGIHGSYDAITGELTLTGTSSVANYQAALDSVTYFDSSDNPSGAPRTVSFSVDDGATANSHSNFATAVVNVTPVDDAPVLNSMTLTITEGGTTVLTNDDFSVTDPDSSSFLYTVDNVTGGQFEVFNGHDWVAAPTGGFTTAQVAAGQVEFVQDGTATAPDFSIFVSDSTEASSPIAPTVNFTPTAEPPTATSFPVSVEGHWQSFASTLILNDSAPNGDDFSVSGATLDGTAAMFNQTDGAYEVQGTYGQLYIYPQAVSGVNVGGFTDASFKAGDYVFVLDSDSTDAIHTLAPGATLADTFTYTITDSVTGLESAPATVTLNFADSDIFTGASGGSWTLGSNWMFGVPASGDIAYIGSGTQVDGSGAIVDGVTVDTADTTSEIVVGTDGAATLTLEGGTTVTGGTITIHDSGTLDTEYGASGGYGATLDHVVVANAGTVQVGTDSDHTASLTLEDGTTITGGTLTIASGSTLEIAYGEGDIGATLDGVSVGNSGTIQVGTFDEDPTLTLEDGTTITGGTLSIGNESTLEINIGLNGGATLHDVTVYVADSSSAIAISDGATLTLNDVSIQGVVINDYSTASGDIVPGDIDVTGLSSFSYASLNGGNVTVEAGQTLTLDHVTATGTTFDATASGAIIQVDGDQTLTLSDATINGGTIDAYSTASGSIIAGDIDVTGSSTISNAGLNQAYVTVEGGQTLTLSEVTIAGGTIDDYSTASGNIIPGDIDVTGSSTISDASLNHGHITIEDGQTLTLENATVTDTTISFAGSGTLKLGQPSLFSGSIGGISGSGDVLDLGGFDAAHDQIVASTGEGSYNSTSNTTVLLVTDETSDHSVTLTLNGDYSNSSWTVTDDQHGGANIVDPPAAKPAAVATIASDMSLEISSPAASAENVTFQGSTGSLTLDHPSSFAGVISGFTGDGTLAGSDQIDLKGIDYHSSAFTESFDAADDTLNVSDGTHSALLHFNGIYQAANFNFATDNHGGTIVYDPPVPNGASAGGNTAPVTATGHGFVFNFAQNGQDATSHPAGDTHLFDGHTFVNAEANVNKLQDEGHANLAPAPDGSEMPSVAAIKAQMHAHDFHFA